MRGLIGAVCILLASVLGAFADGGSSIKLEDLGGIGLLGLLLVFSFFVVKARDKRTKKLAELAVPEGEELIYNRVVNTTEGAGFAFAATREAVYWFGVRVPLAEIKGAGLNPQKSLSKRMVLIVFAVLALVLFFIIWRAWEAMMAAAIGAGALILLGLLIMAFSGGGNTGVQKLTLVRQNGKRFTFNPYLSSISNELRAQYIEAQQEAATVLKHLQVPELPAG
jgi:preprotein translocase subunit YajC